MADIELVIKIPEEEYKIIKNHTGPMVWAEHLIKNGTPLPKGHGDLKDADVMKNKLCTQEASELFGSSTCAEILDFINDEKPIIEADKEAEE